MSSIDGHRPRTGRDETDRVVKIQTQMLLPSCKIGRGSYVYRCRNFPWFGLLSQALIERWTCSPHVPKFDPPLAFEWWQFCF